jgi:hypothetical protein
MDEIALLRSKLADLESKLEEANQRKMPSITNEWIVNECRKSVNKIDRARQLYLDKNKVVLAAAEESIMDWKIYISANESIMSPLSRAIQSNPKGPWSLNYSFTSSVSLPGQEEQRYSTEFVKKMVNKYHSEMLKNTFPTATWEVVSGGNTICVTFPHPSDSLDEYKQPLLS